MAEIEIAPSAYVELYMYQLVNSINHEHLKK